jgi:hemerythrin
MEENGKLWDSSFLVGDSLIDYQHKTLVNKAESLLKQVEEKTITREELEKTLLFLANYASKHFSDEEKVSKESGYPGYPQHCEVHNQFKKKVGEVLQDYVSLKEEEDYLALGKVIVTYLIDWLVVHIKGHDHQLYDWVKAKNRVK